METSAYANTHLFPPALSPHSLRKPIEWKRGIAVPTSAPTSGPHSLRKPIEWKLRPIAGSRSCHRGSPHSLRKPIEWKQVD